MNDTPADNEVFFLARGRLSILLPKEPKGHHRVGSVSPGVAFGEMALAHSGAARTATLLADVESEYDVLNVEKLNSLTEAHPSVKIKLLTNLALRYAEKMRTANRQFSALELYGG